MTLVLGFAPFILFAVLSRLSADLALWAAFAAAFVVTIRDFVESPSLRLLDVGNLALFGALALVRGFLAPGLSLVTVRALAELFLFLLLAASLIRRQPFSLEYAHVAPEERTQPLFMRVNMVISCQVFDVPPRNWRRVSLTSGDAFKGVMEAVVL